MGLSTDLSEDLNNIVYLSEKDIAQMKLLIMDFLAASFAGYRYNERFNKAVERTILFQGGIEESNVFLNKRKLPARLAAFMNSVYGHGAELDDGNKKAAGHVGVHVIPAVFALADKYKSNNSDVLLALATGYEAYIRISSAAQPGMINRGFHSTGVTGTLACAAACAKLLKMNSQGIEDSIALATTMTGGLLSYGDSRPSIKPLNPGKAAENGIMSALLVQEGVRGPENSLEGKNGWFNAVTDSIDYNSLSGGDHLLLHDCYIKLYPSCRHTHCVIDAAIKLHKKIMHNHIKIIRVYIYSNAIKLAGIKHPKNRDETKFSIFYTLASALINGKYDLDDIDPVDASPEIQDLIEKTVLISDDSLENLEKGIRGARVEISSCDGEKISETVFIPKGDPEEPVREMDVIKKLGSCSQGLADADCLLKLRETIERIEKDSIFVNPMNVLRAIS